MVSHPTKPPFSYYGGKQRLASKICALLPPHTVYVEPFCGSGAVYFKKGLPQITSSAHYREVLNDTNHLIVNFFRVMQDQDKMSALCHKLEWTIYSQEEHDLAKQICKQDIVDSVLSAWAWFCNVNWSFSNVANSSFGSGMYGRELATTHYNAVQRLHEYRDRLKCTTVMCMPAIKVIEKFDTPQTCFYVDPPYPNADQGHYSGFTQDDFIALIDALKNCHGAVLLSCYDNPAVPQGWLKHKFEVFATSTPMTGKHRGISAPGSRKEQKRTECVWYKPASTKMREALIPIAKRNFEQLKINFEDMLCSV